KRRWPSSSKSPFGLNAVMVRHDSSSFGTGARRVLPAVAVCPNAVAAGTKDGSATAAPIRRRTVRRERCSSAADIGSSYVGTIKPGFQDVLNGQDATPAASIVSIPELRYAS